MPQNNATYCFSDAIVRSPSLSVVDGLRAEDLGNPDFAKLCAEHSAYVDAMQAAGVAVQVLPPLEHYADALFVEDPAIVFPEGAILLRPGAPSRFGEAAEISKPLSDNFSQVLEMEGDGFAEGGDILTTPSSVMIGLSSRTNLTGARSVANSLKKLGREARIVETPAGVLHFKSDCAILDEDTILTTGRLAQSGVFAEFDTIITPEGEEAAANALRINDVVFISGGYPRTEDLLRARGFKLVVLDTSEIAKIDAGLSCMSLRWLALESAIK